VFPLEIEELLAGHEKIEEVAAIGVDDEKFGQRLRAFVVVRGGAKLTEDEVKKYVSQNLARYKTPREVVFIDELPRNPTGKVLKRELQEREDGSDSSDDDAPSESSESSAEAENSGSSETESREAEPQGAE
jgi:acyl-CoA synthetase (AMP-forming)/AMP-acid ligase II